MSDEQNSGTEIRPPAPVVDAAFGWVVESHRQSAPMAPLGYDLPDPSAPPQHYIPSAPMVESPAVLSPVVPPHHAGPASLALERRSGRQRSGNGPLDWIALILAFLAPPIGLVVGIVAVITSVRSRGYAVSIAKAAIGIGALASVVLVIAYVVESKVARDHAAHEAIVASSAAWCTKLTSVPGTLASDTFGWPAPADTIPDSITSIKRYESRWESLAAVAPAGIRADTQKVADVAKSIASSVQSTQTLNDANDVAQVQNVVQVSGIQGWASSYCN